MTSGAGFNGSNFIYHMLDVHPDYRIVCVDCLTYAGNLSTIEKAMSNSNFHFIRLTSAKEMMFTVYSKEQPDMVVNFAAGSHGPVD